MASRWTLLLQAHIAVLRHLFPETSTALVNAAHLQLLPAKHDLIPPPPFLCTYSCMQHQRNAERMSVLISTGYGGRVHMCRVCLVSREGSELFKILASLPGKP